MYILIINKSWSIYWAAVTWYAQKYNLALKYTINIYILLCLNEVRLDYWYSIYWHFHSTNLFIKICRMKVSINGVSIVETDFIQIYIAPSPVEHSTYWDTKTSLICEYIYMYYIFWIWIPSIYFIGINDTLIIVMDATLKKNHQQLCQLDSFRLLSWIMISFL